MSEDKKCVIFWVGNCWDHFKNVDNYCSYCWKKAVLKEDGEWKS